MDSISIKANAKINLSLDVIRKREDGYHEVRMIMQSIGLHDDVVINAMDTGIEVTCNRHWVPTGSENIAYKAARALMDKCGLKKGIRIKIHKNIPVAAGLAGGSTDAAAVLKGMNMLFSLNLSEKDLMILGKQVGADVPFCIKGGTMLAEGIGEVLTDIKPFSNVCIVLVKPKIGVSTAWVYNNLNLKNITSRPDTDSLIKAIEDNDLYYIAGNMRNVLESVTIEKYTVIKEIKDKLVELGALGSMMSGSGPTVFGIFENEQKARYAYQKIKCSKWECFVTETLCEER